AGVEEFKRTLRLLSGGDDSRGARRAGVCRRSVHRVAGLSPAGHPRHDGRGRRIPRRIHLRIVQRAEYRRSDAGRERRGGAAVPRTWRARWTADRTGIETISGRLKARRAAFWTSLPPVK